MRKMSGSGYELHWERFYFDTEKLFFFYSKNNCFTVTASSGMWWSSIARGFQDAMGSRVLDNVVQGPFPMKGRTGRSFEVPPSLAVQCFCDTLSAKLYNLIVA